MRIIIFILFLSHTIIAQSDYSFNSLYRTFEEGQSFYILKDKTLIHVAPFITAAAVAEVPIATVVKVEERMDELFRIDGFRTNWYRVSFVNGTSVEEGYIWGGNLAVGAFFSKDEEVLFLYGIGKIELVNRGDYDEESLLLQLNACQNNRLLDGIQFEAMGTLYTNTQGTAYGSRGVAGVKDVIEVAFSDGYCGGVSASATLFWDGVGLNYVQLLSNGFSTEQFSNKFFIYPNDEEGEAGRIILRDEAGFFGDNKHPIYTHQIDIPFVWTGELLKAVK